MVSPSKLKAVADAMPNYPGSAQAKKALRPVVEYVGGKWIRREAQRQVIRLVGFHAMWHELRRQGYERPASEMVARHVMSLRSTYACQTDFELVFGATVDELSAHEVMVAAVGLRPKK